MCIRDRNKREARIIRLRYGLTGAAPMTQLETAKVCSISRSYVSRLEKKALEKDVYKRQVWCGCGLCCHYPCNYRRDKGQKRILKRGVTFV